MNRRAFVKFSGAFAAFSLMPISCMKNNPKKTCPMGLQLFTVRDAMERDALGTLRALNPWVIPILSPMVTMHCKNVLRNGSRRI